nr:hypothetical protein DM860_009354 [Ipomoea batatas]
MFDGAVNGGVQVNLDGDQGRSDGVEEEAHLIVPGDDDRRRPLVGSLGLHPRRQGLPPDGDVVAHARKHLVRNRHLQDRLQPIFPVEIRTQFPHLPSYILVVVLLWFVCTRCFDLLQSSVKGVFKLFVAKEKLMIVKKVPLLN